MRPNRVTLTLPEPTSAAISALRRRVEAVWTQAGASARPQWRYLLVTPLGMPMRHWLEHRLELLGVAVRWRVLIRSWPRVSTAVQLQRREAPSWRRAVLYEGAWKQLCPGAFGEAWGLEPRVHALIARRKRSLRRALLNAEVVFGAGEHGVLHAFHLADVGEGLFEACVLEVLLRAGLRASRRRVR